MLARGEDVLVCVKPPAGGIPERLQDIVQGSHGVLCAAHSAGGSRDAVAWQPQLVESFLVPHEEQATEVSNPPTAKSGLQKWSAALALASEGLLQAIDLKDLPAIRQALEECEECCFVRGLEPEAAKGLGVLHVKIVFGEPLRRRSRSRSAPSADGRSTRPSKQWGMSLPLLLQSQSNLVFRLPLRADQ
jgi:hypothetical protein